MFCELWLLTLGMLVVTTKSVTDALPAGCVRKSIHLPEAEMDIATVKLIKTGTLEHGDVKAEERIFDVCLKLVYAHGWPLTYLFVFTAIVVTLDLSMFYREKRCEQLFIGSMFPLMVPSLLPQLILNPNGSGPDLFAALLSTAEFYLALLLSIGTGLFILLSPVSYYHGWQTRNSRFILLSQPLLRNTDASNDTNV